MGQGKSTSMKGDYIASVFHRKDPQEEDEFKDRVFSIALSKDGSTLVSAGSDSVVRWSAATAKRLSTYKTKRGPFYSAAVSHDAKMIAAGLHGSSDVMLWRTDKGELPSALKGHQDRVYCVCFTPDGEHILSGSADSTIKVWRALTGELEGTMEGHEGDVLSLAVAADSSICVSGSSDRKVKMWDLKGRAHGCTLVGHTDEVRCVDISPDGLNIVSGGNDQTIKLWHRRTGQLKGELNAEQGDVCCLDFTHDGLLLVSGGSDGTVKIWNFSRGALLATYLGHTDQVTAVATCPFNYSLVRLVSCSWDETIKFWSLPAPDGTGPSMGTPPAEKAKPRSSAEPSAAGGNTVASEKETPATAGTEGALANPNLQPQPAKPAGGVGAVPDGKDGKGLPSTLRPSAPSSLPPLPPNSAPSSGGAPNSVPAVAAQQH